MTLTAVDHGNRRSNKIALTFDDGPNPFWTEKILDVLAKHNVKANFFVLGKWVEKYRDLLKETFKRGHLIGNHTYSHPHSGDGDFDRAEEFIFNIIGQHTKFIRPPYNLINLCNSYTPVLKRKVIIINNDVVPCDWKNKAEDIKNIVADKVRNGSIILLHDGSEREEELKNRPSEMFKALPQIIEELKKRKFKIVRLDELLKNLI